MIGLGLNVATNGPDTRSGNLYKQVSCIKVWRKLVRSYRAGNTAEFFSIRRKKLPGLHEKNLGTADIPLDKDLGILCPDNTKIHYTSFPVARRQQICNKIDTSVKVCNKLAQTKVRCVGCVVTFSKFHYNDLLRTCWPYIANKSVLS